MRVRRFVGRLLCGCVVALAAAGTVGAAGEPPSVPPTMRAAAIDRAGGPEMLTLHRLPVPKPGRNEVLIAVHTAGVGPWDAALRRHPQEIRHAKFTPSLVLPSSSGSTGQSRRCSSGCRSPRNIRSRTRPRRSAASKPDTCSAKSSCGFADGRQRRSATGPGVIDATSPARGRARRYGAEPGCRPGRSVFPPA